MGGSVVVSEGLASKSEKGSTEITVTTAALTEEDKELSAFGVERRQDGFIYWRSDSADHPRNWSAWRKTFDTTVIILLEFYT